jgi:hypothetical protein
VFNVITTLHGFCFVTMIPKFMRTIVLFVDVHCNGNTVTGRGIVLS